MVRVPRFARAFVWVLMLAGALAVPAAGQRRVILASFDGLGQQILEQDPAARELVNLRALRAGGVTARGVQPAFPSTTANSHAAIWTGAYGNVNGVSANANPVLPRAEHTFLERRVGFRSESLTAEPLWVSAARQGLSVVAHQVTQVYPFTNISAGLDLATPPVVLNSYQTRKAADYLVLRAKDVRALSSITWDAPLPASPVPPKHFAWKAGPVSLIGTLYAEPGSGSYNAMRIAESAAGPHVVVALAPTESAWPRERRLARHFSAPLFVAHAQATRDFGPLAAVFRLWETTPEGDFLLLSMPLQELGFAQGRQDRVDTVRALLREAGPLAGNGPSWPYLSGKLGAPLDQGGDGRAELRYLECMEFLARQYNRYTEWLWKHYSPQLLIDYFPFPDEMDHSWLGLSVEKGGPAIEARAARFLEFRRRGYQIIDARLGLLRTLAREGRANLAVTSDHGMAPIAKNVNINAALREVGYLVLDENEQIDLKRSRATGDYAILLNTDDWKGGTIPLAERRAMIGELVRRLGELRDPETGRRVFAGFYTEASHGAQFGIGGPSGFDLYFDLAPGYAPERKPLGPVVEKLDVPRGRHGFLPTRRDMQSILIAAGPEVVPGIYPKAQSIQIAPTVSRWLGIEPPANAAARPLVAVKGGPEQAGSSKPRP